MRIYVHIRSQATVEDNPKLKAFWRLSAIILSILMTLQFQGPPAFSQSGDLFLMQAAPIQSATHTGVVVEERKTAIKIDVASLYPEMNVVIRVSPFFEDYVFHDPEDYTVSIKPGRHSYYLPPFDLEPRGTIFCVTVKIDPYNMIQERFENK